MGSDLLSTNFFEDRMAPLAPEFTNWDNFFWLVLALEGLAFVVGFVPGLRGFPLVAVPVVSLELRTALSEVACRGALGKLKRSAGWSGVELGSLFLLGHGPLRMRLVGQIDHEPSGTVVHVKAGVPFEVVGLVFFFVLFIASDGVRVVLAQPPTELFPSLPDLLLPLAYAGAIAIGLGVLLGWLYRSVAVDMVNTVTTVLRGPRDGV